METPLKRIPRAQAALTLAQAAYLAKQTATPFPESETICADCRQDLPAPPHTGGTGYAMLTGADAGKRICYSCADKRQVEDLKDRSGPFMAYVSSDGKAITSWTGGHLMTVTRSTFCKLTRQSFTHNRNSYRSIFARDTHGGEWYGRGSAGIVIKMRPTKRKA